MIAGTHDRFSMAGRICSGDFSTYEEILAYPYLKKSGKFVKTLVIMFYVILGLACIKFILE